MLVDTPKGPIHLGDVATVTVRPTANFIKHENGVRRLDVGAGVKGRDLGAVSRDVEKGLKSISFPLEHRAEVIGVYAERQSAQRRLEVFAVLSLAIIVVLLMIVFKNWRDVILHLVTLPIALVGGVIAAYLSGGVLSIGSLVGFFTVLGITARNGIMLISHFQHLETKEGVPFGPELAIQGAKERLAPILMTMLATGLALIPLVVRGDIAGQEIEYPMATDHPRRPHHLDPGQPLHRAAALPPLRQEQEVAAGAHGASLSNGAGPVRGGTMAGGRVLEQEPQGGLRLAAPPRRALAGTRRPATRVDP